MYLVSFTFELKARYHTVLRGVNRKAEGGAQWPGVAPGGLGLLKIAILSGCPGVPTRVFFVRLCK
jgi:hypothetical protein